MADPARNQTLPEAQPTAPESADGIILDEEQVLETLEGSPLPPRMDAPKGIALGVGLGAAIWLIALAIYLIVW